MNVLSPPHLAAKASSRMIGGMAGQHTENTVGRFVYTCIAMGGGGL